MNWLAYCPECKEELECCPNGDFAQAAAQLHANKTGHKVLVAFEVYPDQPVYEEERDERAICLS